MVLLGKLDSRMINRPLTSTTINLISFLDCPAGFRVRQGLPSDLRCDLKASKLSEENIEYISLHYAFAKENVS